MWRAAVARPTDRFAKVNAAGEVASDRGEFWVQSPWNYPPHLNLSAYEPNRVLLNHGDWRFFDVSLISGAGITADGRAGLVADINGDLQPDLIVRSAGGGPLRVATYFVPPQPALTATREAGWSQADGGSRGLGAFQSSEHRKSS